MCSTVFCAVPTISSLPEESVPSDALVRSRPAVSRVAPSDSRSAPERIHADVLGSYLKHTFTHSPFFQMHRRKMKSGE